MRVRVHLSWARAGFPACRGSPAWFAGGRWGLGRRAQVSPVVRPLDRCAPAKARRTACCAMRGEFERSAYYDEARSPVRWVISKPTKEARTACARLRFELGRFATCKSNFAISPFSSLPLRSGSALPSLSVRSPFALPSLSVRSRFALGSLCLRSPFARTAPLSNGP